MKSAILKIAALTFVISMITGCGKKESTTETNQEVSPTAQATSTEEVQPIETPIPTEEAKVEDDVKLPSMTWFGTASVKLKTTDGMVIYIDPFAEGDYSEPADLVLITHEHSDHNNEYLIKSKDSTKTIRYKKLHPTEDEYNSTEVGNVKITAVPAYNKNHTKQFSVGYVLEFDGIKLYHPGDTSKIDEMKDLTALNLTYALYPTDGEYNMGPEEATECANIVGAKHNIPIHNMNVTMDQLKEEFTPEGVMILQYSDTITLEP